jgi:hypothetical protein
MNKIYHHNLEVENQELLSQLPMWAFLGMELLADEPQIYFVHEQSRTHKASK